MTPMDELIQKIMSEGPLSFESFMEFVLYDPQSGYYMKDSTKIGREGDYYTSPHLHRIFGAMLGRQMFEMWELMKSPHNFQIVEMGAGMGYMAKDMLEYLKVSSVRCQVSGLFDHLKYTIVEINPAIRAKQQELLRDYGDKVQWVSTLEELEPITGCFLSNELLDAFPVRLVEMDKELAEIFITAKDNNLFEIKKPCSDEIKEYLKEFSIDLFSMAPYRTEVSIRIKDWLFQISNKLREGFILTIDYGYPAFEYYSDERNRGTLLCYHQHQLNENPYINIGEQDITSHVNFSSLDKWGLELGISTVGFCPQGTYLISLGIDELIAELSGESPDAFDLVKIKGLIFSEGMGESHKVLIQYKGQGSPSLKGFALRNQIKKLRLSLK
jgi:SAM-dependent MidA family methyltransferase